MAAVLIGSVVWFGEDGSVERLTPLAWDLPFARSAPAVRTGISPLEQGAGPAAPISAFSADAIGRISWADGGGNHRSSLVLCLADVANGRTIMFVLDGDPLPADVASGSDFTLLSAEGDLAAMLSTPEGASEAPPPVPLGIEDDIGAGGSGADRLHGGYGADTLSGGDGADEIAGGEGDDSLEGGAGEDILRLDWEDGGWNAVVDLEASLAFDTFGDQDSISGFEGVVGGGANDELSGNAAANTLAGRAGNDRLFGRGGDDALSGGAGHDVIDGGAGDADMVDYARDVVFGGAAGVSVDLGAETATDGFGSFDLLIGIEEVTGTWTDDDIAGSDAANRLEAGGGDDLIRGRGGDDRLLGGEGADTLQGGQGADQLAGGAGFDIADFSDLAGDLSASLLLGTGTVASETDTFIGIEGIAAGAGDDELTGSGAAEWLSGGAGADRIDGLGGDDTLLGGDGADRLSGWGGDDVIEGGAGADMIAGGAGIDLLSYAGAPAGISADLGTGWSSDGDSFTGIEGLQGSAFDDMLTGDVLANLLIGGAGDDWLSGAAGADTLEGGAGADILSGGAGADLYRFEAGFGSATITDFEAGIDTIEFEGFPMDQGDPGYHSTQAEGDAILYLDSGDVLTVTGLAAMPFIDDLVFV